MQANAPPPLVTEFCLFTQHGLQDRHYIAIGAPVRVPSLGNRYICHRCAPTSAKRTRSSRINQH